MRARFLLVATLACTLPALACASSAPPKKPAKKTAAASAKRPADGKATPAATANGAPTTNVTVTTPEQEEEEARYSYGSGGRRDPFLTLVFREAARPAGRATAVAMPKRGEGASGILVDEIIVRGIVQMDRRLVALVQGKDGRSYNVHPSDKLADGIVKAVTPEGIVITQEVNEPPAPVKHREVRKLLRSLEEAKQ